MEFEKQKILAVAFSFLLVTSTLTPASAALESSDGGSDSIIGIDDFLPGDGSAFDTSRGEDRAGNAPQTTTGANETSRGRNGRGPANGNGPPEDPGDGPPENGTDPPRLIVVRGFYVESEGWIEVGTAYETTLEDVQELIERHIFEEIYSDGSIGGVNNGES